VGPKQKERAMVKIARWDENGTPVSGFIAQGAAWPLPPGMDTNSLCALGLGATLETASMTIGVGRFVPLEGMTLLAPLVPAAIRDFVSFEEHVEGVRRSIDGADGVLEEWYQAPTFYFSNPHTVTGTGSTIPIPSGSTALDFEAEVAAIVGAVHGSDGNDLDTATARQHIFGYTIFNDWSARDLQAREMKVNLGPCKGKDFAGTLGTWIVTADEFESSHDGEGFLELAITAEVNGQVIGSDLLSNMGWPMAELLAYASRDSRLVPGDVLGSGTCGNGGCLAELWGRNGEQNPPPLEPGDLVCLTVEGIGTIQNTIGAHRPAQPTPRARPRPRTRPAPSRSGIAS
jgi:2-keto-4-pentenoate hydratase/2-oxohepta-3-ene-1,7-dioic acid hydratase in catechol pathway